MTLRLWVKLFLLFWATNFYLHFAWEFLQVPFFMGVPEADHIEGVWTCTVATFGGTGIALAAYLGAAWSVRSLTWFETWRLKPVSVYFLIGILITVVFEFLATEVLGLWAYGPNMPTLPLIGTGLTPFLQWLILPALALSAVRPMYFSLLYLDRNADARACGNWRSTARPFKDTEATHLYRGCEAN